MKTALIVIILFSSLLLSAQEMDIRKAVIIKKCIDTVLKVEKLGVDSFNTIVLLDLATQRLNFSEAPFGNKVRVSDWYNDTKTLKRVKDTYSKQLKDSTFFLYAKSDMNDLHKTSLIYTFTFPKRSPNKMYIEIGSPINGWGFLELYLQYWGSLNQGKNYFDYVKFDADRIVIPCFIYYKKGIKEVHKEYLIKLKAIETSVNNIDFILDSLQIL